MSGIHEITEAVELLQSKLSAEIKSAAAAQDAKLEAAITDLAQGSVRIKSMPGAGSSALVQFGTNEAVRNFANDRGVKSVNIKIDNSLPVLVKSVVGDVAGAGNNLLNTQAQRDTRLGEARGRRLSIFEALPRLQVSSNSFEYNRLDAYTNAAAYQTKEGAAKNEGAMPTELATAPICTIAHYFKLSEQVLADTPALQMQVQNLLQYGVLAKASAEVIAGSTVGKIQGLATQATPFVATGSPTLADAIGKAATALDTTGWNADIVVMHPSDWFAVRSERTVTEKDYVAGGWANGAEQTIWGMAVVTDPSVTVGAPLVMDSTQVAILDRMDARVEFGRSGDDMTTNRITALGECRVGLAVFSKSAVLKVTVGA